MQAGGLSDLGHGNARSGTAGGQQHRAVFTKLFSQSDLKVLRMMAHGVQ